MSQSDVQDITLEEAKALIQKQTQRKPSKYRNKKTPYNGRVYDSTREARHAMELDARLKAGDIDGWTAQVDYPLTVDRMHVGKYRADFVVRRPDGKTVVEETKGFETAVWKLKRRIFQANYPDIQLRVIR